MYKITLSKDDFLRFQLFTASRSKRIKTKRTRTWLILTASFIVLGLLFLQREDKFLSYYFFVFSLLTLIFYPMYERKHYRKHYKKHIREHLSNKIGVESQIGFVDGYIISRSENQESKVRITEIEEINEIAENLFIKIKTGESLIVPSRLECYNELKDQVAEVTRSLNIGWSKQLDWKWR
ncbi:hypothetical protein EYV94_10425 [Puteibacter caeruleilacunae]|nr:hypothetical protein EYV94_10425 [Puteibacter caeruleilacunae]